MSPQRKLRICNSGYVILNCELPKMQSNFTELTVMSQVLQDRNSVKLNNLLKEAKIYKEAFKKRCEEVSCSFPQTEHNGGRSFRNSDKYRLFAKILMWVPLTLFEITNLLLLLFFF